ncbi:MAG: transposase [bacterium]
MLRVFLACHSRENGNPVHTGQESPAGVATPNLFGVEATKMSSKKIHFNTPGHAHELTFSCYRNRQSLCDEQTCLFLVDAVNMARKKHCLSIWAYVFMPDHVHLLLYPESEEYSVAGILLTIKQSVARRVLLDTRKNHPDRLKQFMTGLTSKKYRFWQDGGGYNRNITNRHTLLKVIDYIHANPVRKGLVRSPEEWKWSSFGDWHNLRCGPIPIDRSHIPFS